MRGMYLLDQQNVAISKNYILASSDQEPYIFPEVGEILKRELTLKIQEPLIKTYDQRSEKVLATTEYNLNNRIINDQVNLLGVGTYNDPSASARSVATNNQDALEGSVIDRKVTFKSDELQLIGSDADNYTLSLEGQDLTINGIIKPITVEVTGLTLQNRIYDGTTAVEIVDQTLNITGILPEDQVELEVDQLTAEFVDPNVGKNKEIFLKGLRLIGNDQNNYIIESSSFTKIRANILSKPLRIKPTSVIFSKIAEDPDPVFNYTYAAEDLITAADHQLFTGKLSRIRGEAEGNYKLTLGSLSAGNNYQLMLEDAWLQILANPKLKLLTSGLMFLAPEDLQIFLDLNSNSGSSYCEKSYNKAINMSKIQHFSKNENIKALFVTSEELKFQDPFKFGNGTIVVEQDSQDQEDQQTGSGDLVPKNSDSQSISNNLNNILDYFFSSID